MKWKYRNERIRVKAFMRSTNALRQRKNFSVCLKRCFRLWGIFASFPPRQSFRSHYFFYPRKANKYIFLSTSNDSHQTFVMEAKYFALTTIGSSGNSWMNLIWGHHANFNLSLFKSENYRFEESFVSSPIQAQMKWLGSCYFSSFFLRFCVCLIDNDEYSSIIKHEQGRFNSRKVVKSVGIFRPQRL